MSKQPTDADVAIPPDAAFHLAVDEALLTMAEAGRCGPSLRIWSLPSIAVVLGRSSKIDRETDRKFCLQQGIPIMRRCSGGASIVGGPNCWMYSVVLSANDFPELRKIDSAHQFVMSRLLAAVQDQLPTAGMQGICDLTLEDRKFSGNALRLTRNHVLYHGTLLVDADLQLVQQCLDFAPRQPDYRQGRDHQAFITNAPLSIDPLRRSMQQQFGLSISEVDFGNVPAIYHSSQQAFEPASSAERVSAEVVERAIELAESRYRDPSWSARH